LQILVARIVDFEPDLVLFGKTVSRLAQDFLLAENIPFTLNLKKKVIHRVARATSADILTSVTGMYL
jgi:1-phosphatidylinositol-3-phosphate 5-kinase